MVSPKPSKPEGKSSSANMAGLGNRQEALQGFMLHVENKTLDCHLCPPCQATKGMQAHSSLNQCRTENVPRVSLYVFQISSPSMASSRNVGVK